MPAEIPYKKISQKQYDQLIATEDYGYYGMYGAIIGDRKEVLVESLTEGILVIPAADFEWLGIFVRLKDRGLEERLFPVEKLKEIISY